MNKTQIAKLHELKKELADLDSGTVGELVIGTRNAMTAIVGALLNEAPEPPWPLLPAGVPCAVNNPGNAVRLRWHCGNGKFANAKADAHSEFANAYAYHSWRPAALPDWVNAPNYASYLMLYTSEGGYDWAWCDAEPKPSDEWDRLNLVYYEGRR